MPRNPLFFFVSSSDDAIRLEEHLIKSRIDVTNLDLPPPNHSYRIIIMDDP